MRKESSYVNWCRRLGWRPAWMVRGMATSRPGGPDVTVDAMTGEVLTVRVLPR